MTPTDSENTTAPHTARELGEPQSDDAGKWYTAYAEDAENWSGTHDSREAAISYGENNYDEYFYVCRAGQRAEPLSAWIGADELIERANDAILDSDRCHPEADDDAIFDPTPEQEADLVRRIKAVCDAWQVAHGLQFIPRTFAWAEDYARIEVTHD